MNRSSLLRAVGAFTFCAALAAGQSAQPPKAAQAAAESSDALNPAFRSRIFTLTHRSPNQLRDILAPLMSRARGSEIQTIDRDGLKALSVRDFPENLAAIEEAVKRLDVEAPVRRQVEFHIHVLFGSKSQAAGGDVPDELKDVLASLKSTLAYQSYTPVASFVQRAADGAELVEGQGQAEMAARGSKGEAKETPIILKWGIYRLAIADGMDGRAAISLPKFQLSAYEQLVAGQGARLASIETNLAMKDGEKVVVGTSMIRDKALIVVLTAKIVE